MARAKRGFKRRRRHSRLLKQAEGYYGGRHRLFRTAKDAVDRAGVYAYTGRKERKRNFRGLWQVRINAACREQGLSYSRFLKGLKEKGVELNRKMLALLAVDHRQDFDKLVTMIRS